MSCKKMSVSKAREAIDRLPSRLKSQASSWLSKRVGDRRGSVYFARENPRSGVTKEQRQFMRQLHKYGVSFRAIETIMHLVPQDGNDAQRQVWSAEGHKVTQHSSKKHERRKAHRMRAHAVA